MSNVPRAPFLFAFCPGCRTLFVNGLGRHLEHLCRRTIGTEGMASHVVEQRVTLKWDLADHVEDIASRRFVLDERKIQ